MKSNYKDFEHENLGVSLDIRLGLPNILLNTYALGFRHVVIDITPQDVMDLTIHQEEFVKYRSGAYSIFTYLRCRNLMLTTPPSRLKQKQEACFIKLYKMAKALRCKSVILNTAPNLQRSTKESFDTVVHFLENMFRLCDDEDLKIYLETTPPAPSHIGHIDSLNNIVQIVGPNKMGIALNSDHVDLWKFNQIGMQILNLDWCLLEYGEQIKIVFLNPMRPFQSLQEEGESLKIGSVISDFPGILSRTRLSEVFKEKKYILSKISGP